MNTSIPTDPIEPVEPKPYSTPKKGEAPVAATLIENIIKLSTNNLKPILSSISNEMEGRKVPLRNPSKPKDALLAHAHDLSSVLYSLIKEEALRTNIPKCFNLYWGDGQGGGVI